MNWHEVIAGFVLLIFAYLVLKDGSQTETVISALSSGLADTTKALQGR